MKNLNREKLIIFFILFLFVACKNENSNLEVHNIFGDNMVLQRNSKIGITGKAYPGTRINAVLNDVKSSGMAGADSTWKIEFPPMKAGGPYKLVIGTKDSLITFSNILLGDVWIASGQSNMVWTLSMGVEGGEEEIDIANFSDLRFFHVESDYSNQPLQKVKNGSWQVCNSENAKSFSAVAYYFAKNIYSTQQIPIGVVVSAIGGTTIKGWIADKNTIPDNTEEDLTAIYPEYNDSEWKEVNLPAYIEEFDNPDYDGYSWFRKEIQLEDTSDSLLIHLGRIDDSDETWLNGQKIGETNSYNEQRVYRVDKSLLTKGKNVIAVRVLDGSGLGGFWGTVEEMYIETISGEKITDLSGVWKFNNNIKPQFPLNKLVPAQPGVMFNAMVAPFTGNSVKGIIWYQGEADVSIADLYQQKMNDLITSWRDEWNNEELPFIYVQLPNFLLKTDSVIQLSSKWAKLREAQRNTLAVPNTGMAVTIDLGEAGNVHPAKKEEVGTRLALQALEIAYNIDSLTASGPVYESFEVRGDTIFLSFSGTGTGLVLQKDGKPNGFALRGIETGFLEPTIKLMDNKLIVNHHDVKDPIELRYNWADNPDGKLYNKQGLPASPFKIEF